MKEYPDSKIKNIGSR